MLRHAQIFPMMSGHKLYHMTLATLAGFFVPLAAYIIRKREAMGKMCVDMKEHAFLCEALKQAKDPQEVEELLQKVEALTIVPDLAWASKGKEEQQRLLAAASYCDEWVCTMQYVHTYKHTYTHMYSTCVCTYSTQVRNVHTYVRTYIHT